MKGVWFWPSDPEAQKRVVRKIMGESELATILWALIRSPEGMSNSQIDRVLFSNSQWRTLWHLRQLMAVGLVEYKVELFGDPGKYVLTDSGKALVEQASND